MGGHASFPREAGAGAVAKQAAAKKRPLHSGVGEDIGRPVKRTSPSRIGEEDIPATPLAAPAAALVERFDIEPFSDFSAK